MPVKIHWEDRGVFLEYSDVVPLEDYLAALNLVISDSRFDNIRYAICDYTNEVPSPQGATYDQEVNEVLATFMTGFLKDKYFAIADVVSNPALLLKSEEYAKLATHPFAIFKHVTDARNWISDYLAKE